jgi:hypothetical protein
MDHPTRNEFEKYCALAEIEQDPLRFAEICKNIYLLLKAKQEFLHRNHPLAAIRPPAPANAEGGYELHISRGHL